MKRAKKEKTKNNQQDPSFRTRTKLPGQTGAPTTIQATIKTTTKIANLDPSLWL